MSAPRKHDHDEIRRLHAEGMNAYAIAKHLGTTRNTIARIIDPIARQQQNATSRTYRKRNRDELNAKRRRPPCPSCGRHRCRLKGCKQPIPSAPQR